MVDGMDVLAHRAIELGVTEQAVDALVNDQHRPLMERVCEFAEGVLANQPRGAVCASDEMVEALRDSLWTTWGAKRQTTDWPSRVQLLHALNAALAARGLYDV